MTHADLSKHLKKKTTKPLRKSEANQPKTESKQNNGSNSFSHDVARLFDDHVGASNSFQECTSGFIFTSFCPSVVNISHCPENISCQSWLLLPSDQRNQYCFCHRFKLQRAISRREIFTTRCLCSMVRTKTHKESESIF